MPRDKAVKMLFQVTGFLLLCHVGFSLATREEFHQIGNARQFQNSEQETLTDNEHSFVNEPQNNKKQLIEAVFSNTNAIIANHNRIKRGSSSTGRRPPSPGISILNNNTSGPGSNGRGWRDRLDEPNLIIVDNGRKPFTYAYSRVNESLEAFCEGNSEAITWQVPPHASYISKSVTLERGTKSTRLVLRIKSVSLADEGEYICAIKKKLKTKQKSFLLTVIEPARARIIEFPKDLTASEGENIKMRCVASGHPPPEVNWYLNRFPINHNYYLPYEVENHHTIPRPYIPDCIYPLTNPRCKSYGNNLLISSITYKETIFTCEAKQNIEKGYRDWQTVKLTVYHKPHSTRNLTIYEKKRNVTDDVPCAMTANPPANYSWFRKVDGVYRIIASPSPNPLLKVNFWNESQYGVYKCTANNTKGYNDHYIIVIPMQNPRTPKIELDKVDVNFVIFKVIHERRSTFTNYTIEYKQKGASDWSVLNFEADETWNSKYKLAPLWQGTTYILKVRSFNDLGISPPSNEIKFTTAFGVRLTVSTTLLFAVLLKWLF